MAFRVTYCTTVTGFSTRGVRCAHCGEESLNDVRRDAAAVETTCDGRNPEARFRIDSRPGSRRGTLTLHFQYSYTVGGRTYTSGKVRFSWSQLSEVKVR